MKGDNQFVITPMPIGFSSLDNFSWDDVVTRWSSNVNLSYKNFEQSQHIQRKLWLTLSWPWRLEWELKHTQGRHLNCDSAARRFSCERVPAKGTLQHCIWVPMREPASSHEVLWPVLYTKWHGRCSEGDLNNSTYIADCFNGEQAGISYMFTDKHS